MVKSKIIVGITLLAVGLAWYVVRNDTATMAQKRDTLLASGLKEQLYDIKRIEISHKNQNVTLHQDGNLWVIKQKKNYPANIEMIRKIVVSLSSSALIEKKTKLKNHYFKLGLDDPSAIRMILFADSNEKHIADIYIGNYTDTLDGTYIRRAEESQTWLTSGDLTIESKPSRWLDREFLSIERSRIRNFVIVHPQGETVKITRNTKFQTDYILENNPSGKKIVSQYNVNTLPSVLENLQLKNVIPSEDFIFKKDKTIVATLQTFDGLEIVARLTEKNSEKWAEFAVNFKKELVESVEKQENSSDESDELSIPQNTVIQMETAHMTSMLSGWVFALPDYKYDLLSTTMNDLTETMAGEPGELEK